ncbi:MAG TPA: DUF5946 family protein [Verrucomicrobiae bacterium]|nr:DUF5946 family protein [Verrucomicrobiae bacterium]
MQAPAKIQTTCRCCGAVVLDDYASCASMFHAVLEREYSDPAYGETHLFSVDSHTLQHSEEHGPRSNAFHLMRLCWLLEHDGNSSIRQERKEHRTSNDDHERSYRQFPFLEPPASRGELTVASVVAAKTPREHAARARAWGRSVWDAWSAHHPWAREQVKEWFQQSSSPKGKSE